MLVGISAAALKQQLATGKGDGEVLQWIEKNAKHKRTEAEIAAWSAYAEQRAPADTESREFFHGLHAKIAPKREDIAAWFRAMPWKRGHSHRSRAHAG